MPPPVCGPFMGTPGIIGGGEPGGFIGIMLVGLSLIAELFPNTVVSSDPLSHGSI